MKGSPMKNALLFAVLCVPCVPAVAGQVCENGRCAVRTMVVVPTKTVVRTTEKVITAPRRVVRSIRSR